MTLCFQLSAEGAVREPEIFYEYAKESCMTCSLNINITEKDCGLKFWVVKLHNLSKFMALLGFVCEN